MQQVCSVMRGTMPMGRPRSSGRPRLNTSSGQGRATPRWEPNLRRMLAGASRGMIVIPWRTEGEYGAGQRAAQEGSSPSGSQMR
jgi:hypothetical protein